MRGFWPPPIWVPAELPAKKWLGRRGGLWIAAAGAAFFLYLLLVGGLALHNGAAIYIGLIVGSMTVAAAFLYTMAFRIGPRDTVTVARLLIAFGFGGLLAVTVGSTTDSLLVKLTGNSQGDTSTVVLLLAGVSEELAKIIAVMLMSRGLADKSVRNGLFIGGAVGLGFAALEDVTYSLNFYLEPPALLHLGHLGSAMVLTPVRAVLTPVGHPLWTALFAAGLFAASKNGRFRLTWRVVVAYLAVSVAHGLWDGTSGVLAATGIKPLQLLELIVLPGIIVGTGLIWIHVARRARWVFQTPVAWWRSAPPPGVMHSGPDARRLYPPVPPGYPVQPSYPVAHPPYPASQPAHPAAQPPYPAAQPTYPAVAPAHPAAQPPYPVAAPAYSSNTAPDQQRPPFTAAPHPTSPLSRPAAAVRPPTQVGTAAPPPSGPPLAAAPPPAPVAQPVAPPPSALAAGSQPTPVSPDVESPARVRPGRHL